MPQIDVKVQSDGFDCRIAFPAVSQNGVDVGALDFSHRIKVGRGVDAAWLKAKGKALSDQANRSLKADITLFENLCRNLSSSKTLTEKARKAVQSGKLDQKDAQKLVEEMAEKDIADAWDKLCKVTLPMGLEGAFERMIADEDKALKSELQKAIGSAKSDYSKRPIITVAVTALSAIVGTLAGGAVGLLAALGGIVALVREWGKHKAEVEGKLATLERAESSLADSLAAAQKSLKTAEAALATMRQAHQGALGNAALKGAPDLAAARKRLESYGVKEIEPALKRLQAEQLLRDRMGQALAQQGRRIEEMDKLVTRSAELVEAAGKRATPSESGTKAALGVLEVWGKNVDETIKTLTALTKTLG